MRYFKTTFMWVIILVAVAGYSYLDFEKTRIEEERKEEATRLLPFTMEEILAIEINKGESLLELERWEDGWRIINPVEAKADNAIVEKFLGYVLDSRNDAEYVMDPDPAPERLAEFGLADPKLRLTLKVGKDLQPHTLIFGDRAPTMGVAFARLKGQKPVYRVLANARAEADKDVYYFRDKKVLRLNPIMIDQLAISRSGQEAIRVNLPESGKWEIEKPINVRADHMKVFEFISSFANTEVKAFEAESLENEKKYGLSEPSVELMFWLSGDAEPTVRLKIGSRSPEKRGYFCSMSDRNNVFVLDEDIVHSIPRNVNELRSKSLFFFEKEKLKRIEIHSQDGSTILVKDLEKNWRRGSEDGEIVDFNLVKEFLDDLASLDIEEFLGDKLAAGEIGLDPAKMKLLMWPEESAVPLSLTVGEDTPTGRVYARSGNKKEVLELDSRVKRILKTYF